MGYALAAAAIASGADVTLISGETTLRPPHGAELIHVVTATEMHHAVEQATFSADALIMAAAVADFRPETKSQQKLKKTAGQEYLDVRMVRNPEFWPPSTAPICSKLDSPPKPKIILENAAQKLDAKGLDMIVANDAVSTIGAPNSTATILTSDGGVIALPTMGKEILATEIVAEDRGHARSRKTRRT